MEPEEKSEVGKKEKKGKKSVLQFKRRSSKKTTKDTKKTAEQHEQSVTTDRSGTKNNTNDGAAHRPDMATSTPDLNRATTTGQKKLARRPLSVQPARTRASVCVMDSNRAAGSGGLGMVVGDYDVNDPDWEEMSQYYEKRAAFSCTDIESSPPSPIIKPFVVHKQPSAEGALPEATMSAATLVIPADRELDPESYRRYRNGLLNERREVLGGDAEYTHCFVCCEADRPGLTTITAMTGRIAGGGGGSTLASIGAGGERPIYRQIVICAQCQFRRDFSNPLVALPLESVALFRPLF